MRDKTVLPEKWLAYSNIGERIAGTVFVAFKVPLDEKFNSSIREVDRFTPAHLMRSRPDLGLVIDLTNTLRYYNPEIIESFGAKHRKVACPGQIVPTANLVKRFCAIVDDFIHARICGRPLIGVHCTHGVNRTGYMICSYMIRHLGIPAPDAMLAFETARGYHIERVEYVAALLDNNMKDFNDSGAGIGRLLHHSKMFQLGTLTEAPTPPDSRASTSGTRGPPAVAAAVAVVARSPSDRETSASPNPCPLAAVTKAAASATAGGACPLASALAAPPPSPSDVEKLVPIRGHTAAKKKKKPVGASRGRSKTKIKKRIKTDTENVKNEMKSSQIEVNKTKPRKNTRRILEWAPRAVGRLSSGSSSVASPAAVGHAPKEPPAPAQPAPPNEAAFTATAAPAPAAAGCASSSTGGRGRKRRRGLTGTKDGTEAKSHTKGSTQMKNRVKGSTEMKNHPKRNAELKNGPKGSAEVKTFTKDSPLVGVGDGDPSGSRDSQDSRSGSPEGSPEPGPKSAVATAAGRPGKRRCGRGGGRAGVGKRGPRDAKAPTAASTTVPKTVTPSKLLSCGAATDLPRGRGLGPGRGRGRGRGPGRGGPKGKGPSRSFVSTSSVLATDALASGLVLGTPSASARWKEEIAC